MRDITPTRHSEPPETTMVYLHIARPNMINVRSPIDSLPLNDKGENLKYQDRNLRVIRRINEENEDIE